MQDLETNGVRRRAGAKIEKDRKKIYDDIEEYFSELFHCLQNEAESISELSLTRILFKLCSCFADEGSPLVFVLMLLDINSSRSGVPYPLIINVVVSICLAYLIYKEKNESRRENPCHKIPALKIVSKASSLMFNWYNWDRLIKQKRESKSIYSQLAFSDGKRLFLCTDKPKRRKALKKLESFYRSHLRYTREDRDMLIYRSFLTSLYYMAVLVYPANLAVSLCEYRDVSRLAFIGFTIIKASYIYKQVHDAKEYYIASHHLHMFPLTRGQLGYIRQPPLVIPKGSWYLKCCACALSILLKAFQIATTFLAAMLLLITKSYIGLLFHLVSTVIAGVLQEYILWGRLLVFRGLFSKLQKKLIPETVLTSFWIEFHQYSQFIKDIAKWTTVYYIPPFLWFLCSYTTNVFNGNGLGSGPICSNDFSIESNLSHPDRAWAITKSLKNSTDWYLRSNPLNAIDYIGGIGGGGTLIFILLIISFLLEGLQKYLRSRITMSLDISKYINMLENMHAFRCMFEKMLVKPNQSGDGNIEAVAIDIDDICQFDHINFILKFQTLIQLNDSEFENVWSDFKESKQSDILNGLDSRIYHSMESEFVIKTERQTYPNLEHIKGLNGLFVSVGLIVSGFTPYSTWQITKRFNDHVSDLDSPKLKHWTLKRRKHEEKFALSIVNSVCEKGVPVCGLNDKLYLLSQIFIRILHQDNNENKDKDLGYIIVFSDILDGQLCEMTPFRTQATLTMLMQN